MNCIYHVASNTSTVLYVYNTDATVNATANSTYQYSCMVSWVLAVLHIKHVVDKLDTKRLTNQYTCVC